jgi:long-chain acyl-CoA synthetase
MRTTVLSYLDDFTARGDTIAFAERRGLRTTRWSYGRIASTAYQFARELEGRGIGKSDRVLLWAGNSPEWVASFFGCLLRGAIVVPLDLQSDPPLVSRIQRQVSAKIVVCDASTRPLADLKLSQLYLGELHAVLAGHSAAPYPVNNVGKDDDVEIVFTSGTTADPKGVRITHGNLLANLIPLEREIKPHLKWERLVHPIRFLNLVPLSHVFGQLMSLFVPQLLGGEVFLQQSLNPSQVIDTAKRERISVVVTVPRALEGLRESVERSYGASGELPRFRNEIEAAENQHFLHRWWKFRRVHQMFGWKFWAFVSGGATLPAETEKFWQRLGYAVIQGYGMTETAALISVNHPFKLAHRSIGKILPGQKVTLATDGEILVRGENVSPGYWNEAQPPASEDGWFRTGDVGELDDQGNLFFKGRRKEIIVTSAGVNIYPEDIELVLDRQPEIKVSAVIETHGTHGPEPLAVLILRHPDLSPEPIVNHANQSLAAHQQVRHWFVWSGEDFPRTATQKIRKGLVAEKVHKELASSVLKPAGNDAEPLAQIVARVRGEASPRLGPSATLGTDLRLDSLGRVELLSALEDRYQIEIDEASFTEATTLGEVEKIIREGSLAGALSYPYPRWPRRWPATWIRLALLYLIVFPAIRIMGWPKISGRRHLRNLRRPLVIVCNHVTMLDHALILFALPWRLRTRAAIAQDGEILRSWRHPAVTRSWFGKLLDLLTYFSVALIFNVFSMPQHSGFRRSFGVAGELMDHGYNLMIFPEGERTKHGAMNPFKIGAGLLIKELEATVVPMRIHGLWKLKQAHRHFAWPREISVEIGAAVTYSGEYVPEQIIDDLAARVHEL